MISLCRGVWSLVKLLDDCGGPIILKVCGGRIKKSWVQDFISSNHLYFIALEETKLELVIESLVYYPWGSFFFFLIGVFPPQPEIVWVCCIFGVNLTELWYSLLQDHDFLEFVRSSGRQD